ncbi:MAG TPA: HlyD family secretion protein [Terriglobales bacterium]|nr:HlyD family secretion protein [Terriglobales bacterium]
MEPMTKTAPPSQIPTKTVEPAAPPPATERKFRNAADRARDPRFRVVLLLAAIVLVVAGVLLFRYFTSYESTDDAQVDGHINSISARVSGHVIKLNVEDNQLVQAGTVLVEIDPTDYQVAVERAQADYNDARAAADAAEVNVPITSVNTSSQLSAADADVLNAQAGINAANQQNEAAKANLQQAEANNVKAQSDLERYRQLVEKQEISQQQYDQAVAVAKASAAAVEAAKANLDAATAQVAQARSRLAQAQANQRAAGTAPKQVAAIRARADSALAAAQRKKADLEQAKLSLQYTKIIAPVAGEVSGRTVEVGQNVQAGQELMKLIPLEDIWVTANFKETQLRDMGPGQKATIYVDATGKKYKAYVDSIAGASGARFSLLPPENATGNYVKVVQRIPVKIVFEPGETRDHRLRPGMSVEPKVWIR